MKIWLVRDIDSFKPYFTTNEALANESFERGYSTRPILLTEYGSIQEAREGEELSDDEIRKLKR